MIASKVESISRSKGKEVLRDPVPMSENEESDLVEIEDEMSIQFGTLPPSNLSVNMAFTLPATFKAKEGQPPTFKGDVEEDEAASASMVVEENNIK